MNFITEDTMEDFITFKYYNKDVYFYNGLIFIIYFYMKEVDLKWYIQYYPNVGKVCI